MKKDTRLALRNVVGPLTDLHHKLASSQGERWLTGLKLFLREGPRVESSFPVWMEARLCNLSGQNMIDLLRFHHLDVSEEAKSLMLSPEFATKPEDSSFELVRASLVEIGVTSKLPGLAEIFRCAKYCGLELCHPRIGPSVILEAAHKLEGEEIYVGMKQVKTEDFPKGLNFNLFERGIDAFDSGLGCEGCWDRESVWLWVKRKF